MCIRDRFWVTPARRGAGLGARLLAAAEREALARGCHVAWLATYDFQARAFYERRGYRMFGELQGFPRGHARHYMVKDLAPPSTNSLVEDAFRTPAR